MLFKASKFCFVVGQSELSFCCLQPNSEVPVFANLWSSGKPQPPPVSWTNQLTHILSPLLLPPYSKHTFPIAIADSSRTGKF